MAPKLGQAGAAVPLVPQQQAQKLPIGLSKAEGSRQVCDTCS
ncbi:hypothetical protein RR42_m2013 [Cupriavidus basilensis]|uniref:Uncharacterized protein n=1 Tax=Cupriavidus basilensis TaxID=68895 RepID=A0A0C4Y8X7_9BURK|nr:hypothetical protein RR42_m2013 [Cupriavidus basilensis]